MTQSVTLSEDQATRDRLNPYARFLSGVDPVASMREAPRIIERLVSGQSEAALSRSPAPGKWSVREILCHLADCELSFAVRLRQAVAEEHHLIQIFDPDVWAKQYEGISAREALTAFGAIREWNLSYLSHVVPAALTRPVTHPRRGTMTFKEVLETVAGHDLNHIGQIERLVAG